MNFIDHIILECGGQRNRIEIIHKLWPVLLIIRFRGLFIGVVFFSGGVLDPFLLIVLHLHHLDDIKIIFLISVERVNLIR